MLKIEGLKLAPGQSESVLWKKAARVLRRPAVDSLRILRRSVDAREEVTLIYSVVVSVPDEEAVLRRRDPHVSWYEEHPYAPPRVAAPPRTPPVVVGAGPAGLF